MAADFASSIGKGGRIYVEFREVDSGHYDVLDEKGDTIYFFADLAKVFEVSDAIARDENFYISSLKKPKDRAQKVLDDVHRS